MYGIEEPMRKDNLGQPCVKHCEASVIVGGCISTIMNTEKYRQSLIHHAVSQKWNSALQI